MVSTVRLEKVKWFHESLRAMQSRGGKTPSAERTAINALEFYEQFYAENFPVVFRAGLSPANLSIFLSWSRLESDFGDLEVESL